MCPSRSQFSKAITPVALTSSTQRIMMLLMPVNRYFAKVLAQSDSGKDRFKAPPPPARPRNIEFILDPDLETVGAVLEGSRLYVLSALYIASQGASWVLLKVPILQTRTRMDARYPRAPVCLCSARCTLQDSSPAGCF